MTARPPSLQRFVDAACEAFQATARTPDARRVTAAVFANLRSEGAPRSVGGSSRRNVCAHLQTAADAPIPQGPLRALIDRFRAIEPELIWREGIDRTGTGSADFPQGHANAMIAGPGGWEERSDIWLGATILAPKVRYPDHSHAPEEVYLPLSDSEFHNVEDGWFSPGIGGAFYNRPSITHAMRAKGGPLFAFWILNAGSR